MKNGTPRIVTIVLLGIVLLPALFYSGYEINSVSRSEELLASIYVRQLDAILYSVNQYAWDITTSWSNQLSNLLDESAAVSADTVLARCNRFIGAHSAIAAVALVDTGVSRVELECEANAWGNHVADTMHAGSVLKSLQAYRAKMERLIDYRRQGYRKLEPVTITLPDRSPMPGIVFAAGGGAGLAVIIIDEDAFILDYLSNKLTETAGNEFVLVISRPGQARPLFATGQADSTAMGHTKELWTLPGAVVAMGMRGESPADVLKARVAQNIVLILLLDVVLAIGAWFVWRTMRREMALVRLKSDFVSNVSHELRTPLALIRMYAETLELGRVKDETKRRQYYGTILNESERLTRLVNNILNFSRIDAGRKQYHKRKADLNDIVSGVLGAYGAHLEAEGFVPALDLAPELPPVNADPEALTEAVINLIDNAMKYSGESRHIRIATSAADGAVQLAVEDHGIGIAAEHHAKIFETFYRVSSGLVHNTKGSGLGLALVKHIAEAHGGTITVRSANGEGSTFVLSLPVMSPGAESHSH